MKNGISVKEIEGISKYLIGKQERFDSVMSGSRDIIRSASLIITALHNNDAKRYRGGMAEIRKLVKSLRQTDSDYRYHTLQAYQEFVEASVLFDIKTKGSVPSCNDLKVEPEAYLLGIMDAVGELKREVIDALRRGRVKDAERYYNTMSDIYDSTRGIRFAESVLNGFRRKQDVARMQIESAASSLLSFKMK
ncbi:MAG: hypothetical protein KGH98_01845 [Candidatus Micrarchaeota archaeon]|nr:hypothetical protein [Candidatus Micrarchaeota archaeon]